jgi:hypothetical protein
MISLRARVGLTTAAVVLAACGTTSAAAHAKPLSFFEKNESFVYTAPGGKPQQGLPAGQPASGSTIEFTDLDYAGTEKHHQHPWTSTDHFLCTFSSNEPTCEGQIAIGASMLIVKGKGGQGTFSIPIVAGTGSFKGDRGTLHIHDIGETANANITIDITKR